MLELLVDFSHLDTIFKSALIIFLCPLIWNILARLEYYTKFLTKLCGGNRYLACYLLAAWIIGFSFYRDAKYERDRERESEGESKE